MNSLEATHLPNRFSPKLVLGLTIIAVGLLGFLSQVLKWGLMDLLWPLFLIGIGLLLLRRAGFPQAKRSHRLVLTPPSPNTRVSGDPGTDSTTVQP